MDTKYPAIKPMCRIMFYNQLPTSDTIHKWNLAPEVGQFHIGVLTDVEHGHWGGVRPWNGCVKSCFIFNCQLLTAFTSGMWLQKWAGSTSVTSPMWNPDTGADTKCPPMEPMCQIMFYNQLPLLTPFTSGPWLQKCAGSTLVPSPTLGRTPSVHPWKRCVISCFVINSQLLTPFTSGPWLQKWAGFTSVPSLMWNPDTGADTKCRP